jgi:hypothetical protein
MTMRKVVQRRHGAAFNYCANQVVLIENSHSLVNQPLIFFSLRHHFVVMFFKICSQENLFEFIDKTI